jgi:ectoine hydroxylase-related dioxygenase (phytanoyl-CoA dioxygenase family)
LKVVRGSHKKTWQCARNNNLAQTNNEFVNVVDQSQWNAADEAVCEIEQGSAVFFSDNLIHGSCTNTSGLDRYAIISTYQSPGPEEEFDKIFPARHTIISR